MSIKIIRLIINDRSEFYVINTVYLLLIIVLAGLFVFIYLKKFILNKIKN